MFKRSKSIFLVVLFLFAILSIPFAAAFTLDVNCPSTVDAGSSVTCTIDLSEDITDVFGDQFEINAPGFTAGTPFLDPDTNGVSSYNSGGLGATTILLKFSEGQSAGPVATFHLVAGTAAGDYVISLTNYVTANSTIPDTIMIAGPATSPANTTTNNTAADTSGTANTGTSGGGGSGGGGSGGGSSGSRSSRSTQSGTSITDVTEEPESDSVEKQEASPLQFLEQPPAKAASSKSLWFLLAGMGILIVVVVSLLVIYIKRTRKPRI